MTQLNHVMVDLETFGMGPNARVLQIGAVRFNPETQQIDAEDVFEAKVNDPDGDTHADTAEWWVNKNPATLAGIITSHQKCSMGEALRDFKAWLADSQVTHIWSNGANFDNIILRHKFEKHKIGTPWKYYQEMCHRTLMKTAINLGFVRDPQAVAHDALDDALQQARQNLAAHAFLKGLR